MTETETTSQGPYRFRIGSYGVLHPLGSGGMSSVYHAVHVETGHEVALKVLPTTMARNSTILKRFVAEARSAEDLQHPNIVQIYDRGSDDGRFYLVLEYVEGGDLHEYVQHQGPLELAEAVEMIIQVAQGLEYAASRGVIHRDVKPSNVLRTPTGEIKIIDLGLALRPEAEDERVTREGTTVGTVDYMAPEQARDSRATSFQSDIYSLGCTLHYLLTGLPPFPGGGVTEKLTRHARIPPPDVRESRPDLPPAVSSLLQRMMAKKPEDRPPSYRALIDELRALIGDESSVALVPLEEEVGEVRPSRPRLPAPSVPTDVSVPELSLATLADELLDNGGDPPGGMFPGPGNSTGPIRKSSFRRKAAEVAEDVWIWRCVIIGVVVIVVVIGLDLIIRPFPSFEPVVTPPRDRLPNSRPSEIPQAAPESPPSPPSNPLPDHEPEKVSAESTTEPKPEAAAVEAADVSTEWVEPSDPTAAPVAKKSYPPEILQEFLPEWARSPVPITVDGPRTVVRRAPDAQDAGAAITLRQGLDVPKGLVEIADAGPFPIHDLRIPGETRLIRSRPGYRAVVRIEGARLDAVRALPGVFNLEGRTLILDSLDLVVNVRDMGLAQRSLFHLSGGDLILKDCTVTIYNPMRTPFAFARSDGSAARPSRIRLEDTLVRGDVRTLFEMGSSPMEAVAIRSVMAVDGPIAATSDAATQPRHALYALGSAMGSRGPLIDLGGGPKSDATARRLSVRAFDSAFCRFGGPGVASFVHSESTQAVLERQLDWIGADNLFAGWLGYFSVGPSHVIRQATLAAFRSTWNREDRPSREIASEYPAVPWIADLTIATLRAFLPGWETLFDGVAQPRPHFKSRTLFDFPAPVAPTIVQGGGDVDVATFDADAAGPEEGDLGAFLRHRVVEPGSRLRVRVVGTGTRRMSPVRLPQRATVEIQVDPPPPPPPPKPATGDPAADKEAEIVRPPLIFQPAAGATGDALLTVDGGFLSIKGLRLHAEEPTDLKALVRVEDGSLALSRCELAVPREQEHPPVLIDFRAPWTRPRPAPPSPSPLEGPLDRPACVLEQSILTTSGDAFHAEVGMGIVSLSGCAVGALGDVFRLSPSPVARHRFFADLKIDRCTIAAAGSVVRALAWTGTAPGPDRPWLITSSDTAYVDLSASTPRESVLCRADADALAQGQIFWRQDRDAVEVQGFAAGGDSPLPNRNRDVVAQWVDLWGADHLREVSGPRPGSSSPSVRLLGRPRPGLVLPRDLVLDQVHQAVRLRSNVGADPAVFEILMTPGRGR